MSAERLVVYTTIYPGCEPFLESWCSSLRRQTDRDADLWIGLDGLTPAQVETHIELPIEPHWILGRPDDTPASLRQRAFASLVEHYDKIVLVDADDLMEPTRVASARQALEHVDVAGCALRIADARGSDLGVSFGPEEDASLAALLVRYNVFGLSNSAYRAPVLQRCLPVPKPCVLIDWLLVTRALLSSATLGFDNVPGMWYRQHGANSAPVLPPFSSRSVLAASERVALHYRLLLDSDWEWSEGVRAPYEAARSRVETFLQRMQAAPALLSDYVDALNRLAPRYVWWWSVAHPDLEHLWIQ